MQADKPFPKDYLKDRKRQAEHRVYRQLAESELPGLFIFEWKRDKKSAEVDFIPGFGVWASSPYRSRAAHISTGGMTTKNGTSASPASGRQYLLRCTDVVWRRRAHPLVAQDTRFPEFRAAGLALHGHGPGP